MAKTEIDDKRSVVDAWINEAKSRHNVQLEHINTFSSVRPLDEAGFRALDSTLKKLTAFMKKLKNIGSTTTPSSLLPELEKLNVSKFLDEIAANICEAKVKISDLPSLIEFCCYSSEILTAELKKHIPFRKADTITNPSKLRVDLRFLADLVLHGVLKKEGMQLLGSSLAYIINTDKTEHVNVSILLPLCRSVLFDMTGLMPLTQIRAAKDIDAALPTDGFISPIFTEDNKKAVTNLLRSYVDSLVEHLNTVRMEMNRLHKSIKRQERTRGDASADDRQKFEQVKTNYDRLFQSATDLSECLGSELPTMVEEPSDDEQDELATKKLDIALSEGRIQLWPDVDSQIFYERLTDVRRLGLRPLNEVEVPDDEEKSIIVTESNYMKQDINESVDNVDVANLENLDEELEEQVEPESTEDESEHEDGYETASEHADEIDEVTSGELVDELRQLSTAELVARGHSVNIKDFLAKLSVSINRELIDNAAVEFITHFDKKSYRKRLIQHLLNAPTDRLDLLPFYARFLATLKIVIPEITLQVMHELLVKFSIIPKAEALTCLRSLLVDLKHYKVDMLCAMIESMGLYLSDFQILLDNAYFCVIPPEEENAPIRRAPPIFEYLRRKVTSTDNRLLVFRKINWDDEELSDFVIKLLSNPCSVRFEDLDRLASLVGALSGYHSWIGTVVVDNTLEFIRLALEFNHTALQQRCFSSIAFLGQLFNYSVCGSATVLYQLITFNIVGESAMDELVISSQRIRLACELVDVVCEFFCKGSSKIRMDCFLYFLLHFNYEMMQKWDEFAEQLGEFPGANIKIRDEEGNQNTRRSGIHVREDYPSEVDGGDTANEDADEQIRVHTEHRVLPEDEEFMRDLDRLVTETMQSAPVALKGPMTDLEVPPLARQKFERKITFATTSFEDTRGNANTLLPSNKEYSSNASSENRQLQMALMTRGKGNRTVLKAVKMESDKNMHEGWRQYQEQKERERREMKHVTLAMNERIRHEQQEAQLQEINESLNGINMNAKGEE
ncbi:hypothetical protein Ddc_06303 [Ditylenchus destructor]|nr:hypothetical protein Ddc_06303 [Ditylenchus destructor]